MRWALCLSLALCGLSAVGAEELTGIQGPALLKGEFYLGHLDGKVRLGRDGAGRCDWAIRTTEQGTLVQVSSSKPDPYHGWYLGYDSMSKAVILTKEPGDGSYWAIDKVTVDKLDSFDRTIHPKSGPLAGWYLDVGVPAEKHKDRTGKEFMLQTVVLFAKPKAVPRFYLFEIAP